MNGGEPCPTCGHKPRYWVEPIPGVREKEPFFTHRVRDGSAVVCHANLERCEQVLAFLKAEVAP